MWFSSFVEEPKEDFEGLDFKPKSIFGQNTSALLVLSVLGLVLQVLTGWRMEILFPAVSWAVATLLIAALRPTTAPKGLLVLFASIFVTQTILLVDSRSKITASDVPAIISIITAFLGVFIILFMPLRDPTKPTDEISAPFSEPKSELRSPEDNITLWNFMTVSWMKPLIDLGNERQLHEEDVWGLGYEFKHRTLHDGFRDLKGSVLARLIQANGLDLIILTGLAVVELSASESPVLLPLE